MIHICDNFFNDPYEVRRRSFDQDYQGRPSYPGVRSFSIDSNATSYIHSYVKYHTKDHNLEIGEGARFQYVTKEFGQGVYHRDDFKYICIVYLSLDAPPNSGTEVCDAGWMYDVEKLEPKNSGEILREFHQNPSSNLIKRFKYDRLITTINSHFKPIALAPNKFNSAVIFPANSYHRAQNFFGTSIENSRLTLVCFLGKQPPQPANLSYYQKRGKVSFN